jgi:hypothetical protein
MAARLVQVGLVNNSDYPIRWIDDGRPHGFWQNPWFPSNVKDLRKGQSATWRLESGGIATGVEGWAKFLIDVPSPPNIDPRTESFELTWKRPYIGRFTATLEHYLHDIRTNNPPHLGGTLTYLKDHGFRDIANMASSPFEFLLAIPGLPMLTPFELLENEAHAKHVFWLVELRNAGQTSSLPLETPTQGLIYAVAGNGDLLWFRHEGRNDGSVRWTANHGRKVGAGWGNFQQVFSGGDGVIYAVQPVVEASHHVTGGFTPASGGELWWFRHDGRNDGSFRWTDNHRRKVGAGWGNFQQVFSGGDGVIYAVDPVVEGSIHATGGSTTASGGDLWWFRHEGRNDGSFRWTDNHGRKVGSGWGSFQRVFSGGDGIIYAVNPAIAADGTTPASGGDLFWYRHLGRANGTSQWEGPKKVGTGWGGFQHVFSGGNGVIYAVDTSRGSLWWYRHVGREDGSFRWEGPKEVGTGWQMKDVFSG